MDRQAFREKLQSVFKDILLDQIHAYVDQQFDIHRQTARYISALDRKYENGTALDKGLPSILNAIGKEVENNGTELPQVYETVVESAVEKFPEQVTWQQSKGRFIVKGNDNLIISAGKKGKTVFRRISRIGHKIKGTTISVFGGKPKEWSPWQQTIPMQQVVRYHLLNSKIVKEWIHRLERVELNVISDLEELLVLQLQNGESKNQAVDLASRAKSLEQTLNDHQQDVKKALTYDFSIIEAEVLEKIKKVGTIEKREGFYNESRIERRQNELKTQLESTSEEWQRVHELLHSRAKLMLDFLNLQNDLQAQCTTFVDDLSAYSDEILAQPLCELHKMLTKGKSKDSVSAIDCLKEQLMLHLKEQMIVPLQKALEQEVISKKIEHFLENLLRRANQVSQDGSLVYGRDLDRNPPQIEFRSIDWRMLVVRSVREHLVRSIQPSYQQYVTFLSIVLAELRDIGEIIEVNMESALAVADDEQAEQGEDAEEVASEALQRLLNIVEDLQHRLEEKSEQILGAAKEGNKSLNDSLLALVRDGDIKQLQLLNAKYRAKETTKGWKAVYGSRVARLQDWLTLWARFGWKKVKTLTYPIGAFLGFREQELKETKRADIATYLSETDKKMKELPYIYRRVFNFDAVADQRFYVPVVDSAATFKKAYEQWQQSFPATFAIVGEKGSGKSTFLNLTLESELTDQQPIQIVMNDTIWKEGQLVQLLSKELDISGVESVQEIVQHINHWDHRQIITIESIQNCFVRNLNGYEAIEKLCYLISETREQIFWTVSCSRYAWQFLDKAIQLSEYFSYLTTTDVLDAEQIKKVILSRHRSSGYTIHFEPSSDTLKSRGYRKLMDQQDKAQQFLQENYFKKLTELAEGNASVAMIFWIRSISEFDDNYCYIQPLEVTSVQILEDLRPRVLFTLAAFVLHDTLTDTDLSVILNTTRQESRLMLNRLQSRGLLVEQEQDYVINHLMYRQIVRVLKERNIIHLV